MKCRGFVGVCQDLFYAHSIMWVLSRYFIGLMKEKKYNGSDIRDAIIFKFGSVENYAGQKKLDRSSIYQKIERQTTKFIKSLIDDGIKLPEPSNSGNSISITESDNSYAVSGNGNNVGKVSEPMYDSQEPGELEKLKRENERLKGELSAKNKQLAFYEKLLEKQMGIGK